MAVLGGIGKDTIITGIDKVDHETIPAAEAAVQEAGDHLIKTAQDNVAIDVAGILGGVQVMLDKLIVDLNRTLDRVNGVQLKITEGGFKLEVPPLAER